MSFAVSPGSSRFPRSEIATLIVRDKLFEDWESVWLQHKWGDSFAHFRFIAAERTPPPSDWTLLQFKPGDECQIELGGQLALTGLITDRQVSYDANRHQVQLIGKSKTHWGYSSSVDTPTLSFDKKAIAEIFQEVLSPYPGGKQILGVTNPLPFEKMSADVGELTWDFLERLAKIRGNVLTATPTGDFLLIGHHAFPVVGSLIEGKNIKAMECVISHDLFLQGYETRAHKAGSDDTFGSQANEIKCLVKGKAEVYSKVIIPMETPGEKVEACDRAYNEALWREGTEIVANVIVYGWTQDGTNLWRAGQNVFVDSPMAMLNMTLKVRTVTFEQNDHLGTQTTLEVVAPWVLLDDAHKYDTGKAGVPTAPVPADQGTPIPSATNPQT